MPNTNDNLVTARGVAIRGYRGTATLVPGLSFGHIRIHQYYKQHMTFIQVYNINCKQMKPGKDGLCDQTITKNKECQSRQCTGYSSIWNYVRTRVFLLNVFFLHLNELAGGEATHRTPRPVFYSETLYSFTITHCDREICHYFMLPWFRQHELCDRFPLKD